MKHSTVAIVMVLATTLGACESLPITWRKSVTSMKVDKENTAGTLFIWSNDVNAGMVNNQNKICMQRAMTARGGSAGIEAQAPAAIFNLSEAAVEASEKSQADAAATMSAAIAASVTALSTTSERTAFLDIGMFYLCQLAANDTIDETQTETLTRQLFTSAAGMTPAGTVPRVDAPRIETGRPPEP